MQSTEWLPVHGHEGAYEVSSAGDVRNVVTGRVLKGTANDGGYLAVKLRRRGHLVHRLVAIAFLGAPEVGQEVCHGNGNPADNRVENLRWGTRSENTSDQVRHGTHNHSSLSSCPQGHDYTVENTYVHPQGRYRRCRTCMRQRDANRDHLRVMVDGKQTRIRRS
ncbi:NUMOD4 motif-containing HNH endonuclease [Plantibacter sp. YIM 135249]|uniref:NUMOD4 motif-containing HNH endonuclease n=1 Tax=Plantibacter sp. YIM 135249 TaxID=3423918 RepID=UPI003D34AE64